MTVSLLETTRATPSLANRIDTGSDGALIAPGLIVPLSCLATRRFIDAPTAAFAARSVLILTYEPIAAALALAGLDGIALRVVLCPPHLDLDPIRTAVADAEIDTVVCDAGVTPPPGLRAFTILSDRRRAGPADPSHGIATEWTLFTSGTSGAPKLAVHTLAGLAGALPARTAQVASEPQVWATFYDIRRYGGLQMLLRALVGGHSLVLSGADEPLAALMERMAAAGVTHVSGTPSHWRKVLMSPALDGFDPKYVRLSGEIADQTVLDSLRRRFPNAAIGHAYASTEAGVGFEVPDGLEGFPVRFVEEPGAVAATLRVVDGALQLRSERAASGYLGEAAPPLRDADGFVDTGDMVERRGDRFHFVGRRSGIINVGGMKIHPEEVEAVINACPGVRMSRVGSRRSPLLGALVTAEVMLGEGVEPDRMRAAILAHCRSSLPPHKTPASIRFVEQLMLGAGGKLDRHHA